MCVYACVCVCEDMSVCLFIPLRLSHHVNTSDEKPPMVIITSNHWHMVHDDRTDRSRTCIQCCHAVVIRSFNCVVFTG